jgi:dihydrolipoamide dehydrogenase
MSQYDVVFIGGGPGGYVGAIRASQLGLKTACVEMKSLGGTCLNVGCIPSKALLESSELVSMAQHDFGSHGIEFKGDLRMDILKLMKRKEGIVSDQINGISFLFKKHKVTHIQGKGKITGPGQVEVKKADGTSETLATKSIVIATGSVPRELPNLPFDGEVVGSSTEALSYNSVPKTLLVVGGGYIGLEMGSVWNRLGSKVIVVDLSPEIVPTMDQEVSKAYRRILEKQGFEFVLGAKIKSWDKKTKTMSIEKSDGSSLQVKADKVLVSAGRVAYTEGVGLESVGVKADERGVVQIDDHFQTSAPGVYAIGDCVRGPMLAHKAEEEGVAVADILAGKPGHVNYDTVPGIVYTYPEVASVGKTEEQLKASGIEYNKGKYPYAPNGRAKALGATDGFVKILADKKTDRILGVHIIGARASEMISEAVIAMEFKASSEDLAKSFHGHPTLSEIMREAALDVLGQSRQK